jgi:succinoglycan biosynthesis transport protein ExoP
MSLYQLWSVLRARWISASSILLLIVAIVATWSLVSAKRYTATSAVLLDVRSADPIGKTSMSGSVQPDYMGTQMDLVSSERVVVRAIHALKLDQDAVRHEQWIDRTEGRGDFDAWLADDLRKTLEVKRSRDANILNIAYTSTDPVFAAAVANAIVTAYMDTTLELKVEPARKYSAFFDQRTALMRSNLEAAQSKLSAYQQAKGIVATDERVDVENTRLAELSRQVVMLQGAAAESSGRQRLSSANDQGVLSNVLIGNIAADLSREEARLNELRARLGDSHPQVIAMTANVDQLRSRLATETRRVTGSFSVTGNVDRSSLAQAQAALAEQRDKLLKVRGARDEASVLVRDVDSAQKSYDAVLERSTQAGMESQNTSTNVAVVKVATPPAFASSRGVLMTTALGVLIGLLVALIATFVQELLDRRLRFESDLDDGVDVPLFVRMPGRDARVSRHSIQIQPAFKKLSTAIVPTI